MTKIRNYLFTIGPISFSIFMRNVADLRCLFVIQRCSRSGEMCIVLSSREETLSEDDLLKAFDGKVVQHCLNIW